MRKNIVVNGELIKDRRISDKFFWHSGAFDNFLIFASISIICVVLLGAVLLLASAKDAHASVLSQPARQGSANFQFGPNVAPSTSPFFNMVTPRYGALGRTHYWNGNTSSFQASREDCVNLNAGVFPELAGTLIAAGTGACWSITAGTTATAKLRLMDAGLAGGVGASTVFGFSPTQMGVPTIINHTAQCAANHMRAGVGLCAPTTAFMPDGVPATCTPVTVPSGAKSINAGYDITLTGTSTLNAALSSEISFFSDSGCTAKIAEKIITFRELVATALVVYRETGSIENIPVIGGNVYIMGSGQQGGYGVRGYRD